MTLDADIERKLQERRARRRGDELDFLCIAHEEQNPSASWNPKKGVWHCMKCGAGGSSRDLAERLGIHVETPKERAEKGVIVATYDYRDEAGRLLYQHVRKNPKAFSWRRPDGQGNWIWNLEGTQRVLYRLPDLLASDSPRVYIAEGEKDVDRLWELGLTATCNPDGAGEKGASKWYPKLFNQHLAQFREIVILPDRDTAGDNHAAFVAMSLRGLK